MERGRRNELSSRGLARLTSHAAVGRVTDRVVGNELMSTIGSHHLAVQSTLSRKFASVNQAADMRAIFDQFDKAALCNWPGERSTS